MPDTTNLIGHGARGQLYRGVDLGSGESRTVMVYPCDRCEFKATCGSDLVDHVWEKHCKETVLADPIMIEVLWKLAARRQFARIARVLV